MRKMFYVSMAIMLLFQFVFASPEWPNEPATSVNMLDCPFNDPACGGQFWTPVTGSVLQPSGGTPFSSPNALAHRLAVNANMADGSLMWPKQGMGQNIGEMYVGLWWKINANFQGYFSGSNKVFFVRSMNYTFGTEGTNGVFTLLGSPDNFPWQLVFGPNTTGLDNTHACAASGQHCYPNIGSVPIYRDTWYHVEAYVKSSTCSTCKNGIVRWWINGTLVGDYRNLNYGSGVMNEFVIDHTWDGQESASCYDPVSNPRGRDCSREWIHYFDHLRISNPNCGSGGCTIPPYVNMSLSSASGASGRTFSGKLNAFGAQAPYTYTHISGNLPAGLTLNSDGTFSGTLACGGKSTFTVQGTDANGVTGTKEFTITVSGTPCTNAINEEAVSDQPSAFGRNRIAVKTIGEKIQLSLPNQGSYLLSVYDLTGKKVHEHRGSAGAQKEIEIKTALKNGIYFAKIGQGREVNTVRLSVMK